MRTGTEEYVFAIDHLQKIIFSPVHVESMREIAKAKGIIALGSTTVNLKRTYTVNNLQEHVFNWLSWQNLSPSEPNVFNFHTWADADDHHIAPEMGLEIYAPKDPEDLKNKGVDYCCFNGVIVVVSNSDRLRMEKEGYAFFDY